MSPTPQQLEHVELLEVVELQQYRAAAAAELLDLIALWRMSLPFPQLTNGKLLRRIEQLMDVVTQ